MLVLPLCSVTIYLWLDRLLCSLIAMSMFTLGIYLAQAQGLMLLMSFSGKGVAEVVTEIESEPTVTAVVEARFWQVHYGLCMANLKLRVRGTNGVVDDAGFAKIRERIQLLVRNRLGGGYGNGGVKWEVTTQLTLDGNS
jgi:Co/Zn/Cd efflux system component